MTAENKAVFSTRFPYWTPKSDAGKKVLPDGLSHAPERSRVVFLAPIPGAAVAVSCVTGLTLS